MPPSPQPPVTETLAAAPTTGRSRKTPDRPCLNCGDPTPGNFCRSCGQRKLEIRVTLRRMLMEALDDQFSLNSALPRTLLSLFLRPGHLTREYMSGRIARYIPPFRLYLISSLLFFLVLSFGFAGGASGPSGIMRVDTTGVPATRDSAGVPRNWIGNPTVRTGSVQLDSIIRGRLRELGEMEPQLAVRRVWDQFLDYVPQTMFLLLPVFAGILKLLYWRRGRLYVEHFVFALHLHAFTFLCFTIEATANVQVVEAVIALWICLYTYLAMYRVYGQGWFRTGVKYVTLGFAYMLVLSLALVATLIVALALM